MHSCIKNPLKSSCIIQITYSGPKISMMLLFCVLDIAEFVVWVSNLIAGSNHKNLVLESPDHCSFMMKL